MKGMRFLSLVLFFLMHLFSNAQQIPVKIQEQLDTLSLKEQAQLFANLCWENREKHTDLALLYGQRGIEISETNNFGLELSKLYNFVGVVYQHYKHDVKNALYYYDKGLEKSLQTHDSIEVAYVYNNLGDAFYASGNIALANEYANNSLAIFKKLNNKLGIAYGYINLGIVQKESQEYDSSIYYINKAIELRKELNDSLGIASAILEIAYTHDEMGESEKALEYFRNSFIQHKILKNKNYMAYSYLGMGNVFTNLNKYDSAYYYYDRALMLNTEQNNLQGVILCNLGIATIFAYKNKPLIGEKYINRAFQLAKETQNPTDLLETYKTWANFYNILEDYKKASKTYQNYITIYDSLYSEQQFETMTELKTRFQTSEQLYKTENDLKSKEREKLYLIIILSVLGVLSIPLYLGWYYKVKYTKELERTNNTKDKLFSIISHDLINPFNVLIGFSEMLTYDLENNAIDDAKDKVNIIMETSIETHRLLINLLTWARSQRGKLNYDPEQLNIYELIDEATRVYKQMADAKEIELTYAETKDTMVFADKNLTRTVLLNLIVNAIKFTPKGGHIQIFTEKQTNHLIIHVKDDGVGMNPEKAQQLFENLNIESTSGTDDEKGTGLGLALCNEFVQINKGKISVTSKQNKGSDFYFTIPLSK